MPSKGLIAGLAVIAAVFAVLAGFQPRFPGDLELSLLLQSVESPALVAVMGGLSYVFDGWRSVILVAVSGLVVWRSFGRLEAGMVGLSGVVSAVNWVFKLLVDRPRPSAGLVSVFDIETTTAFPSGHAFFATVVVGMLAYLVVTHETRPGLRALTLAVAVFLVLWIGVARVYLGVHWTSDVIGGYLAGLPLLLGEIRLYRTLRKRPAF